MQRLCIGVYGSSQIGHYGVCSRALERKWLSTSSNYLNTMSTLSLCILHHAKFVRRKYEALFNRRRMREGIKASRSGWSRVLDTFASMHIKSNKAIATR